jgi:predicted nuclease of predicted toxin-antitoxin system
LPVKIYADESVNVAIVDGLKRRGVDAFSARDIAKLGMTDDEQLDVAAKRGAVIFSHDSDFLKLALNRRHSGIVFVHRQKYSVGECIRKLKFIAETKSAQEMLNQIIFL